MFFYDNINVKENVFFQSASWERHCATHWRQQRGWDLVIFDWFVLSMRMQVILDSSFVRPGSAPIWGGKKGEFRNWTRSLHNANKIETEMHVYFRFKMKQTLPLLENCNVDSGGYCLFRIKQYVQTLFPHLLFSISFPAFSASSSLRLVPADILTWFTARSRLFMLKTRN